VGGTAEETGEADKRGDGAGKRLGEDAAEDEVDSGGADM
jgi:hypothetical protein